MSAPPSTRPVGEPSQDERAATEAEPAERSDREIARLRSRVSELESALAQKEREVEAVRHQYEAILDERESESGRGSVLFGLFR